MLKCMGNTTRCYDSFIFRVLKHSAQPLCIHSSSLRYSKKKKTLLPDLQELKVDNKTPYQHL